MSDKDPLITRAEQLRNARPELGPDSTVTFLEQAIDVTLSLVERKLIQSPIPAGADPENNDPVRRAEIIRNGIDNARRDHSFLPDHGFHITAPEEALARRPAGTVTFNSGQPGRYWEIPHILTAIYRADPEHPDLGVPEFIIPFIGTRQAASDTSLYGPVSLTTVFNDILQAGNLTPESPVAQLIAVAYIVQTVKQKAVNDAQKIMLPRAQDTNVESLTNAQVSDTIASYSRMIQRFKFYERYIKLGLSVQEAIAQRHHLTEENVRVIMDVAFGTRHVFRENQLFRRVYNPIIIAMAGNQWDQARAYTRFLEMYACETFPEWRALELARSAISSNLDDLALKIFTGQVNVDTIPFPSEEYRALFLEELGQRLNKLRLANETRIEQHFPRTIERLVARLYPGSTVDVRNESVSEAVQSAQRGKPILREPVSMRHWLTGQIERAIRDDFAETQNYPGRWTQRLLQALQEAFNAEPHEGFTLEDMLALAYKYVVRTNDRSLIAQFINLTRGL